MRGLLCLLLILIPFTAYASDITIISPIIKQTENNKDRIPPLFKGEQLYACSFTIKNVSKHSVVVATELSDKWIQPDPKCFPTCKTRYIIGVGHSSEVTNPDGSVLFPEREDLKLVNLKPGESVNLSFDIGAAFKPKDEVSIFYEVKDYYGGKFQYWSGELRSKPLRIGK